jgi:hypothetical protein
MQVESCRVCHGNDLYLFLDLGETALANSYLLPKDVHHDEPKYPLRTVLCRDCGLVQIDEEVPAEVLFKNYLYVSGTSDFVHQHAAFLARHFTKTLPLKVGDLVLEAASNDGTVLRAFQKYEVKTVGIEPAENIAKQANSEGIETVCKFFHSETAQEIRSQFGPAKLILARHVLAHVADLHSFVEGLRIVLDTDGVAVIECPHLLPFHNRLEYDTIYHEHLCYFSLSVLQKLFAKFDLELIDVMEVSIHGGSIVVSAQRKGGPRSVSPSVQMMLIQEFRAGLHLTQTWNQFGDRVLRSRDLLRDEIDRLRTNGETLAGYGAPAKGMTLLSYVGLTTEEIPFIVDKSKYKQGRLTPGHHILIDHPDRLLREQPDVVLMLAWNFADEIMRQQAEYLHRGGRFFLPLPIPYYPDEQMQKVA